MLINSFRFVSIIIYTSFGRVSYLKSSDMDPSPKDVSRFEINISSIYNLYDIAS